MNFDAEISADGQAPWFTDGRVSTVGVLQSARIVVAERQGTTFVRDTHSASVLATVNRSGLNYAPSVSVDGRELFFTRVESMASGCGRSIYRAARADGASAFGLPERVSAVTRFAEAPSLSADGHLLYFHKMVNGTFLIYCVRR